MKLKIKILRIKSSHPKIYFAQKDTGCLCKEFGSLGLCCSGVQGSRDKTETQAPHWGITSV